MDKLVLATGNKGKVAEITSVLSPFNINVVSQNQFNVNEADETGLTFVENAIIKARNAARRQYAERTAINAPMQGSAADIIKRAMINIDSWLQSSDIDARMIMQVHDELVFEVKTAVLETFTKEIENRMNQNDRLSVTLEVDIGHGKNWDEAH